MNLTIIAHLHQRDSRTFVKYGHVDGLVAYALLAAIFIDRFIKSIPPARRKTVYPHAPPVPIVKILEAQCETEKNN